MFNSLLCTFLNIFQGSFPIKYRSMKDKNNSTQEWQAKFKATLRKYQHTHFFYSVDEFFMCKNDDVF
jgi:hypothetical protein